MDENHQHQTFMHVAASQASEDTMAQIVQALSALPKAIAVELADAKDSEGHTALDLARGSSTDSDKKMDWIHQIGCCNVNFYYLGSPPGVLVFYRLPKALGKERDDAIKEVNALERYFTGKKVSIDIMKDFTVEGLIMQMWQCATVESGLIVFILSGGEDGVIEADGKSSLTAKEVMSQMCSVTNGRPKVSFPLLLVDVYAGLLTQFIYSQSSAKRFYLICTVKK